MQETINVLINRINAAKLKNDVRLFVHQSSDLRWVISLADVVGDALTLATRASHVNAKYLMFASTYFTAENAKILNPNKNILSLYHQNCPVADSLDYCQIRHLRQAYAQYTFVCSVNSSAFIKSECDVCVTSSNIFDVIAHLPNDKIFYCGEKYAGAIIAKEVFKRGFYKEIISYGVPCSKVCSALSDECSVSDGCDFVQLRDLQYLCRLVEDPGLAWQVNIDQDINNRALRCFEKMMVYEK